MSWTTTLAVLVSLATLTHQQYQGSGSLEFTRIPDHLLDCYWNQTLNARYNRIPSTIGSLISIIQKLENGAALNMDMRTLSTTILRQYRVDGIQRDPTVMPGIGMVPFGPSGHQTYRMTYLFNMLLPATGNPFPNGTLTPEEKCALHFMLSDSIDDYERGDTCGQVSTFNSRRPRSVGDEAPVDGTSHDDSAPEENKEDATIHEEKKPDMPPGVMPVMAAGSDASGDSSKEANKDTKEVDKQGDVEIDVHKSADPQPLPDKVMRSGRLAMGPGKSEKQARDYPKSNCPLENGVIYTPSGPISAGIMLSGIATGLQPQSVSIQKLLETSRRGGSRGLASSSSSSSWSKSLSDDKLSNLWFATLAGDLAEATIYQGPSSPDIKIGATGGWNDTTTPRWYFLSTNVGLDFTDAEIRGGLDGLIIGSKIVSWNSAYDNRLRLSQVLDMYYSGRGFKDGTKRYRACQRKDYLGEVAPMEDMKSQAFKAAKVLLSVQQQITMLDPALQGFADTAAQRLSSYIPSGLADAACPPEPQSLTPTVPSVDLVLVLDTNWAFNDASTIIRYLTDAIQLQNYGDTSGAGGVGGSRLTILSGKDGTIPAIVNGTTSSLDVTANFTMDNYNRFPKGLDMVKMLARLRQMYAWSMQRDRQNKITTGRPQVVIFMPSSSYIMGDSERSQARSLLNRLNVKAPDTSLLFMGPMAMDTFYDFVVDKNNDIFPITISPDYSSALTPVVKRLAQFPRRIINPACTYKWESDGSGGTSVQYVDPASGALFFRLLPNYFFSSDKTVLRFKGRGDGTLNVCYARKNVLTGDNSTSSSSSSSMKCKSITSDTAEFTENQPCSGASLIKSCDPMYFSVVATSSNMACNDPPCRFKDMVRVTVEHSGLTCASGAMRLLTTGHLIALWIVLFSSREVVNRMFFSG